MKADTDKPSILVSFASLTRFKASPECYRDWVLDSGAYSVLTSGRKIDLSEYIEVCKRLQVGRDSSKLVEVFALDVIGDPERSARNVEIMVREGVRAIPTFHFGSQWSYLEELARKYEKIALGGLVARGAGGHGTRLSCKMKLKWLEQCFARIWPKWIHGFGCCDRRLLNGFLLSLWIRPLGFTHHVVMERFSSVVPITTRKIHELASYCHRLVRIQLPLRVVSEYRYSGI